jgi:hypothetical protein
MSTRKAIGSGECACAEPGAMVIPGPPYERVAAKAYELYLRRDQAEGHDLEDWLEAERLVRFEMRAEHKATAMVGPISPTPPTLKVVGGRTSTRIR